MRIIANLLSAATQARMLLEHICAGGMSTKLWSVAVSISAWGLENNRGPTGEKNATKNDRQRETGTSTGNTESLTVFRAGKV